MFFWRMMVWMLTFEMNQLKNVTFAPEIFDTLNIIFRTFTRIFNLMLHPAKEWEMIAAENNSRKTVFVQFVLPLLCMITIASIIGTWINTSRELYSVAYVLYWVGILWASLGAGLYFSAFLITELMAHQVETRDHNKSFALMAYATGAAYLTITIVSLFPFFFELLVLAFYACYLYWRGIPYLIRINGHKRMIYGLFSFIIVLLIYSLMFFFFEKVLRAILL